MADFLPVNADLHVDVMSFFWMLDFLIFSWNEELFDEVQTVEFLDGKKVG